MSESLLKMIVVILGVVCTLGIYSILYKENKIFRLFEHLYLGLAGGYAIAATWNDVLKPNWWEPMVKDGQWMLAMILPAGSLFYFIYSKKNGWMARLIFGVFIGFASGQAFQSFAGDYWPKLQTAATKTILVDPAKVKPEYPVAAYATAINNLLFLAILASVMVYFFFSFEQKNAAVNKVSKFGRYAMMVAFGAMFGNTIMARMALLIGRIYFMLVQAPESVSAAWHDFSAGK